MMEKRGVVEPGRTRPDDESVVKAAAVQPQTPQARTEALDDDFTKRAADRAAGSLQQPK